MTIANFFSGEVSSSFQLVGNLTGDEIIDFFASPLFAVEDVATTPIDRAVVIDVLANDLNSSGGAIALDSISSTANGTVSRDDNGTPDDRTSDLLVYTPNSGFNGIDSCATVLLTVRVTRTRAP